MNRFIKGVILDWAGTTIDYGSTCPVIAIQNVFLKKSILLSSEDVRKDMGLLKIDHLRRLIKIPAIRSQIEMSGPIVDEEEYISKIYEEFDAEIKGLLCDYSDPVPGLNRALSYLRKQNIKIGSTTGYTEEMMKIIAPRASEKGYTPDFWISSSQVPNGRPYPWMIYRNAEFLGLPELHKVIKIGDTASDIQEGKNAGCWTVGILEGSNEVGLSFHEKSETSLDQFQKLKNKAHNVYGQENADFVVNAISDLPEVLEQIAEKISKGQRPQQMTQIPRPIYTLFTPGPISTSTKVKLPMMIDFGSRDPDYTQIVEDVRDRLIKLLAESNPDAYTTVIMQGSGTFGVESVINSAIPSKQANFLVLVNGQYGKRMAEIAAKLGKQTTILEWDEKDIINVEDVKKQLESMTSVTHVGFVHSETTTGLLNPIDELSKLIKCYNKTLIVDSISSFGTIPLDANRLQIDFAVGSSNKGFQSVPGFSFIIAKKTQLAKCQNNSTSVSLDLYDQWVYTDKNKGAFRFTPPTHSIVAFQQALRELADEGGVAARYQRCVNMQKKLVQGMEQLGFKLLDLKGNQGPIITTFHSPKSPKYNFSKFYDELKKRGCMIYPGKLTQLDTFRIGTIGNIQISDIDKILKAIEESIFWK